MPRSEIPNYKYDTVPAPKEKTLAGKADVSRNVPYTVIGVVAEGDAEGVVVLRVLRVTCKVVILGRVRNETGGGSRGRG